MNDMVKTACTPQRQSEIRSQMENLNNRINHLIERIEL